MAHYESFLREKLKSNKKAVKDALTAIEQYRSLAPSVKKFSSPYGGKEKELVCLQGTIPVLYRGTNYNIPICIWLQEKHPLIPPFVYVIPTDEMQIKAGRHVDGNGRIYLPYLTDWKHPESHLLVLIQVLCLTFGEQPPLFKRDTAHSPATPSQRSLYTHFSLSGTQRAEQIPLSLGMPQVNGPASWTKAKVEDWFENCVCKELEIDREIVSQFMLMNGKGLNMLLKEDWLSSLPDLVGDLVFRKWNDLKKQQPNKQSTESGGTDIKKGKKSVLDGKLLTKAKVKDWFANICKDLEIDKEMVSQFTLMNGKGLNLLLKEDWLNRLPNLLGDLLFRMWNDLKEEQPYEQSSETDIKERKKSVLDGKLLTKAQVKDWFANICKDLEIDKEMVSQFTFMNGKGLNLLLKEDWLNTLPDLVGDLLFRMWSDMKEQPNEQSSGTGTKKEEILEVDENIQDTIPLSMQGFQSVLDPRKYFVVKQIGSGACGKVYLCQTKDRLQNYAVKQVDRCKTSGDQEAQQKVKDLKNEIQMLKRLKNNNIVTFYFYEETVQTLSIFMEYVPGGSISDYVMKNGEMQENIVRKYTYQMLKGCEYLHKHKVIHRDIKGGNVLIDDAKESIRLSDFGISKDLQRVVTSGSTTGQSFRGTIYWCSPEHIKKDDPTYVFDIWSVGCTVVEMLTTKPPHRHLDFFQAMYSILNEVFHPPDHLSSLAKTFIELCFKEKGERPDATGLLKNEFPAEYVLEYENS